MITKNSFITLVYHPNLTAKPTRGQQQSMTEHEISHGFSHSASGYYVHGKEPALSDNL